MNSKAAVTHLAAYKFDELVLYIADNIIIFC